MAWPLFKDLMKEPMTCLIITLLELDPSTGVETVWIKFIGRIFLSYLMEIGVRLIILSLAELRLSRPIQGRSCKGAVGVVLSQFLEGVDGFLVFSFEVLV